MLTRRWAVATVAFALLSACTVGGGAETTTGSVASSTPPTSAAVTTVPPPTTTITTLPAGTENLPEEVRAQLADLIAQTEQVRGLQFQEPPTVTVVSSDELARRVRDQLTEDLADVPADQALYRLLGLITSDTDLTSLYSDLYSEQVAGYYDGDAKELVVPISEEGFTPTQQATLIHELTHALTDQYYGFHQLYTSMIDQDHFDQSSAYQALIEGDAVLAEFLYIQALSPEQQGEFFADAFSASTDVFQSAPKFIQDALVFPYDSGFIFANRLHDQGGFDAVASAYENPPASTEQIIDPSNYPDEVPVSLPPENVTIDGYDLAYRSTWGELGFSLMFNQFLDPTESDSASRGWGGDTYDLLFDGTDAALALHYQGDTEDDAGEMAAALEDYVAAAMDAGTGHDLEGGTAYEGNDHAWVRTDGSDVYFVAASAEDAFLSAVAQAVPASPTGDTTATTGGG